MHTPPAEGATPALAQWFAVKQAHPDALAFFRMGDFYELFFADAEIASAALDIALTTRGTHAGAPIPMCGVPAAAADAYLSRLIRRGFRIAVAEQMEPAASRTSKAPIRREVVRLITPGTLTDEAILDPALPNLLLALVPSGEQIGAAWADISTGLFETETLAPADLTSLLGRLDPAEILAPDDLPLDAWSKRHTIASAPSTASAHRLLGDIYTVSSTAAFGTFTDIEIRAAALILSYVRDTQAGRMPQLGRPVRREASGQLAMDAATRASLEILRARDGGTVHTLLASIQRTVTAGGARKLANWLQMPLMDRPQIIGRQTTWLWLTTRPPLVDSLRTILRSAPDLARALARISVGRHSPRDLAAVRDALTAAARLAALLTDLPPALAAMATDLVPDQALSALLTRAMADTPPVRADDGGAVRPGFDGELDAQRELRDTSRRHIAALQLDLAQRLGVASLKIKHHAQLGYVVEVPAASVQQLRAQPDLILRQGMANGARFSHPEVADLDRRIAEAAEHAAARERLILAHLAAEILASSSALTACADALALLDVGQSAASLMSGGRWCCPQITDGTEFQIVGGRHPVVEAALDTSTVFTPNLCDLSPERRVLLLTGPNMAGKSTYLRQNALLVVLAQAGLPVPAEAAEIGLVDRLFSRVGAADDLARGRSTFMMEMTETAAILNQAGPRSLVVVDEIGRGTSTLDGLAIAWAVLESLHSQIRCRTIFATHFHELATLAGQLPRLSPHTMRVKEWQGRVVFLHEVAPGTAGRSWGVHVAQLAGVPATVVRRAAALLKELENRNSLISPTSLPLFAATAPSTPPPEDPVHTALLALEPDSLSPREALEAIYRLRTLLSVATQDDRLA